MFWHCFRIANGFLQNVLKMVHRVNSSLLRKLLLVKLTDNVWKLNNCYLLNIWYVLFGIVTKNFPRVHKLHNCQLVCYLAIRSALMFIIFSISYNM